MKKEAEVGVAERTKCCEEVIGIVDCGSRIAFIAAEPGDEIIVQTPIKKEPPVTDD